MSYNLSVGINRRSALLGLASLAPAAATLAAAPALSRHALVAREIQRWPVPSANQAAAVDATHFYGIGNRVLVKHRKDTGQRVAQWTSPRGGNIVHFNAGYVEDGLLVLAHSNYPQRPPASSLETHDAHTLKPVASHRPGTRSGSLTWSVRRGGSWWACFAYYNGAAAIAGHDNRSTWLGEFDDRWQLLRSWLFPPEVIATWGANSASGGDWGEDGLLYTTGHDAAELYVMRLPASGETLEYVTTIDVPFEGQGWAWDRSARNRVIYGISRSRQQIIAAEIPPLPAELRGAATPLEAS